MFVFDFLPVIRVRHGAVAGLLHPCFRRGKLVPAKAGIDPAAVFTVVVAAVVVVNPLQRVDAGAYGVYSFSAQSLSPVIAC